MPTVNWTTRGFSTGTRGSPSSTTTRNGSPPAGSCGRRNNTRSTGCGCRPSGTSGGRGRGNK